MRIIAAQINPTIGDFKGNTQKIIEAIERARSQAELIVFPELSLCGYPPEDLLLHPSFVDNQTTYLEKIITASKGLMVVVGLVRKNPSAQEKPLFNSAAIIQDGVLMGFEDKRLLPTYDVFDEARYFERGGEVKIWKYQGKRIGVLICEDIWQHAGYVGYTHYAHDPVLDMMKLKPDLVINISASPYQFQKPSVRVEVCAKSAKSLSCPLILCCQVGGNDQLIFDGYSLCVDKLGQLRQVAKGFEADEMLIDLEVLDAQGKDLSRSFFCDPIEDLYKALVLGVRDYFHKSGVVKACLGLSGGIDSALVAVIAAEALGKENVLALSMPSIYSSPSSVTDAEVLAKNLQIELMHVPIEKPFNAFLDLMNPRFKTGVVGITEENMQARVRGMILMAVSNQLGCIVLSTGNKSELAMGYCTLYGDMCGGLSVISDVTKEQVYLLARFINCKKEIIPQSSIDKAPSAELKPNQKDTDSLPDYPTVDKVLQSYVEECLSAEEIAGKHDLPLALVEGLIHRIHAAEYKRRQAAPGLRVTKKAFSIGRRYPIVQKWS